MEELEIETEKEICSIERCFLVKNKMNLGIIGFLPSNLRTRDSYAVIDQVRTVDENRAR